MITEIVIIAIIAFIGFVMGAFTGGSLVSNKLKQEQQANRVWARRYEEEVSRLTDEIQTKQNIINSVSSEVNRLNKKLRDSKLITSIEDLNNAQK